ncbi:hypothetical protein QYE76_030237 [Lolium multiflorum]|uniref:F-box domain-containing protein n=2 Tax=Lolium TaxID=4520 RepID=A0AAD8QR66_LOLMU|nr:hypothetical protein QYE76_030237 [Lolium multiflorum]
MPGMAILKSSSIDSDASGTTTSFLPNDVDLGGDLLAEIIRRLPLDSVARSRAVSRNWRAAISDGYLRRRLPLHMSMICFPDNDDPFGGGGSASLPLFACATEGRRLEERDIGFFPLHDRSVVCDACNGLLLCRAPGTRDFYVVSPVTRTWAALPRPAKDASLSVLAFDPFGTSPQQHYHVINFTGWRDRGAAVEVFSSETRAWTAHEVDFGGVPAGSLSGASVHCHDGAAYFLASDPDCAVRMDLAAGAGLACTVVALPEPSDGHGRLAHCGSRLHYVCSDGELLKVWALEDVQRWRLKHAVRVGGDIVEGGGGEVRFLAMHPEKSAVVYLWSPWKLVEYDLSKRELTGVAWEFAKGARNRVVKTWLVPSSCYLSDCFADAPAGGAMI